MKTFILLLFVAAQPLYAQTALDRIEKTDQSFIEGKVTKVTDDVIEYKHAANPDGPVYTIAKQRVRGITYGNGYQETFSSSGEPTQRATMPPTTPAEAPVSYSNAVSLNPPAGMVQNSKYQGIRRREPFLAGVLSFVIPGVGQAYNKQYGKGAAIFGTYVLSWVLASREASRYIEDSYTSLYTGYYEEPASRTGYYAFLATAVATDIYAIVDAAVSAKKINERYGLASRIKIEPQTQFAMQDGQIRPTWGGKLIYSLH